MHDRIQRLRARENEESSQDWNQTWPRRQRTRSQGEKVYFILTLTCPIGLPSHTPVAQKNAELCTLIASLVKRLFVRVDWTERLRDDSSTSD